METWRLIQTWDEAPGFNMGLDELLLERDSTQPALRLYTWSPETLSLGYFQRWRDVPVTAEVEAVVRRITGGGAIHHARELTFSITLPATHPLYRGRVGESYLRVHRVLIEALGRFGVRANLVGDSPGLESDRQGTGMCFHGSTPLDIAWANRKGVGSAQRRRAGRVLHHGSIKLDTTPLEGEIATLAGAGREVSATAFAQTLIEVFKGSLEIEFEPHQPTPEERGEAGRRGERYTSTAFLQRR